jgi:hypothetical protein
MGHEREQMSYATVRKMGLKEALRRRVFIVFVARERDVEVLGRGHSRGWTVPSSARPGDMVVVYKPGARSGYTGTRKPPFEVFVAAGIVYSKPKRLRSRLFNAPIAEVEMFPKPLSRSVITEAFSEWKWLRHMRGSLGVEVPSTIVADLLALIDRFAYGRSTASVTPQHKG